MLFYYQKIIFIKFSVLSNTSTVIENHQDNEIIKENDSLKGIIY